MFCAECGVKNDQDAIFCQNCGNSLIEPIENRQETTATDSAKPRAEKEETTIYATISEKDKGILIILAFFGALGLDRFYRGQIVLGILKLITFGGCGIWTLIDFFMTATGIVSDSNGKFIVDKKTLDLIQRIRIDCIT